MPRVNELSERHAAGNSQFASGTLQRASRGTLKTVTAINAIYMDGPDRFDHLPPRSTSPGDRFRALPRLRRMLLLGCLLVCPLDEADNGSAGPHAQEVHRDEK